MGIGRPRPKDETPEEKAKRLKLENDSRKRRERGHKKSFSPFNVTNYNARSLYYKKDTVCGLGRMQLANTCWFHACLNTFLLSVKGRKLLIEALEEYEKVHPLLKIPENSCPRRGTINKQYFWTYVKAKLTSNVNSLYRENNLIKNLGLRNSSEKVDWGTKPDVEKFVKEVLRPDSVKLSDEPKGKRDLIGGWIVGHNGGSLGHAISGFLCRGVEYIFDSNQSQSIKVDWYSDHEDIVSYFSAVYGFEQVFIIYIYSNI